MTSPTKLTDDEVLRLVKFQIDVADVILQVGLAIDKLRTELRDSVTTNTAPSVDIAALSGMHDGMVLIHNALVLVGRDGVDGREALLRAAGDAVKSGGIGREPKAVDELAINTIEPKGKAS